MKNSPMSILQNDIAIDLGTANTLVYVKGQGIVISEPSVVAIDRRDKKDIAIGRQARAMMGKTHGDIEVIRPMRDGVIDDDEIAELMIRRFIRRVQKNRLMRPRIIVCVPSGVTKSEKRVIRDSAEYAGAREVHLIAEPMAAALGVNLPVKEPVGSMIVDVGGGTTEIAIMSLGGIVTNHSIRIGGDEMDEAIAMYIRRNYNLLIGERMAEWIKCTVGSAMALPEEITLTAKGRDLVTGMPKAVEIGSEEIREALSEPVSQIVAAVREALEKSPPELSADIRDRGIILAGGGALLRRLDQRLRDETNLPANLAEDPATCVVRGTGKVLDDFELYKDLLLTNN
ncbi:MAG: rod shape-determining protein [Calditrichaeota bacterium]|jgi:rod shape-determining protein MreB and related proteins|nr:rod shape-determining protein [Calditrichota bacterium]MBT7619158.1 rod shape-determining protein [Calditrichota bacterium]MBT7789046.1 rod shape-determining protein [Calditrichota bacterium]